MTTHYAPTEEDRELLISAGRVLGGNLSELLLSGLGGPHQPRRRFTAESIKAHGVVVTHQLEIVAESGDKLPGGRDPLVMAALLQLLLTSGQGRDELAFNNEELLAMLGWADTSSSRAAVESAIERYFFTAYYARRTEPHGAGRAESRHFQQSQVQKLVTGYDTIVETLSGEGEAGWRTTVVYFNPGFSKLVAGDEKYFLGIDFGNIGLLRRSDP